MMNYPSPIAFSEWLPTGIMVHFEGNFPSSFQHSFSTSNERFSRTRYSRRTKVPA